MYILFIPTSGRDKGTGTGNFSTIAKIGRDEIKSKIQGQDPIRFPGVNKCWHCCDKDGHDFSSDDGFTTASRGAWLVTTVSGENSGINQ